MPGNTKLAIVKIDFVLNRNNFSYMVVNKTWGGTYKLVQSFPFGIDYTSISDSPEVTACKFLMRSLFLRLGGWLLRQSFSHASDYIFPLKPGAPPNLYSTHQIEAQQRSFCLALGTFTDKNFSI